MPSCPLRYLTEGAVLSITPYKRGKTISSLVFLPLTLHFRSTLGIIFSLNAISRSTYYALHDVSPTCRLMRAFLGTMLSIVHPLRSPELESSSTTHQISDSPLLHTELMVTTSGRPLNIIGVTRFFFLTPNPQGTVSPLNGFLLRSLFLRLTRTNTSDKRLMIS